MGSSRRIVYAVASKDASHVDATLSRLSSVLRDGEVTVVESADAARREVEDGDVAAVLSDYELPDETGTELASSLVGGESEVSVVLFTGRLTPDVVSECQEEAVTELVQRKSEASTRVAAETVRSVVDSEDGTADDDGRTEAFRRHLQVAVEAIEDGIYALDDEGRFVAVNDAYAEMTGYPREELLGEPASKVIGDDFTTEVEEMRSSFAAGADVVTVEGELTTASGRSLPIEARAAPYPLGDGRYGRVGVVRDISERRRLEKELNETLERITDGFFAVDTDWRFTYVNERAEELLQRSESDLLGEVVWDEFPAAVESTFQGMYERAMETQEPVSFEEYFAPLETWFEVNAYPSESGLSVYFQDVTERVEAEEHRRERERQFEAIFNDPLSFFALLDSDGTVRQVNEAALEFIGADHDDVVGEYFWNCPWWTHSDALQSTLRRKLERVAEGEYVRFEAENRNPEGDKVTIDFQGRPVELDGAVTGIVAEGIDITAQKEFQRELRHQRDLNQQVIDTAPVGIVVVDDEGQIEYSNERMEELAGVSLDRIQSDEVEFTFVERDGDQLSQDGLSYTRVLESDELPFTHVLETGEAVYDVEIGVVRPDGEIVWASVNGSLIREEDGSAHGIFTLEDVTEAKRRAERFEALNQRVQRLPEAETADDVCRTIIEAAADVLELPCSYIALYDENEGALKTAAATDRAAERADTPLLGDERDSPVWDAFVRGEVTVEDLEAETDRTSVAAIPLGDHGVFVTITTDDDAFSETDLVLVDMLGATAQSSLDRASRERVLRHQRNTLEEKNDRLERVNRINRAIRNITQVLIRADTHEQIESLVCERLASIEPYTFAWIGHVDHATDEVSPVVAGGDDDTDLDALVAAGGDDGSAPYSRVVETKRPQVHNDILRDAPSTAWREEVLARGFRASIAIPIQYRNTLYGVLNLYSEKPEVFEEMETTVLEELGETIGYAMNAVERKKALVSESSVELKFDVPTLDGPFLGFADGTGGSFRLENVVRRLDGHIHVFFTIAGVDRAAIYEDAEQSADIDRMKIISESEDDGETTYFCECTLHRDTFVSSLVDRGALLDTITVEDGSATITIRIPQSADVRDFVEVIEQSFGGVNLLARRELDEPVMTSQEFKSEVRNRLTERQEEVIKTAYFSGFFDWPRKSNGQEVAEMLGVTQPTVNRHIRAGERTMFGVLFDQKAD
jgi:PAS domain S-box-containing protein